MIDDFTAEYGGGQAPLHAMLDKLDDLATLGVNAILVMPWTAWQNRDFDWGYDPFQYFAVETRDGQRDDTCKSTFSKMTTD